MVKLSRDDVLKLARLAQLELDEAEIEKYGHELSTILDYVTLLDKVDVTGLQPTDQVTGLKTVTRPDEIMDYGITQEALFKNVPAMENGQIKVKRVIE